MTAWGTRPFDSDEAIAFAAQLDALPVTEHAGLVRAVLSREPAELRLHWQETVAAAAVVAVQCPTGGVLDIGYGPAHPVAELPTELRGLGAAALTALPGAEDRTNGSTTASTAPHRLWRARITILCDILATTPAPSSRQTHGGMHLPPVPTRSPAASREARTP
ncbi:DUF4259 domain-containing protein [Streptomyces sp. NPDC001255]|uniref:DUF4259 domain-containing protein n=1 Tax=Streptomyces sp. NPDC001255 TaxID=3364550 RepID=UPI0036C009C5